MKTEGCCDETLNTRLLMPSRIVMIAAIVLIHPDGRVLIAQRPLSKSMGGLWEFPGGKIEASETPEAALVREMQEELGLKICAGCLYPLTFASYSYEAFHLLMPLYGCRQFDPASIGEKGAEGQVLKWVTLQALGQYPMPPANRGVVGLLHDILA